MGIGSEKSREGDFEAICNVVQSVSGDDSVRGGSASLCRGRWQDRGCCDNWMCGPSRVRWIWGYRRVMAWVEYRTIARRRWRVYTSNIYGHLIHIGYTERKRATLILPIYANIVVREAITDTVMLVVVDRFRIHVMHMILVRFRLGCMAIDRVIENGTSIESCADVQHDGLLDLTGIRSSERPRRAAEDICRCWSEWHLYPLHT